MNTLAVAIAALLGFAGLVYMLVRPAGAAVILLLLSPFDAIFYAVFSTAGNAVTYFPILGFMLRTGFSKLSQVFLGTRIQIAATSYVGLAFLSHFMILDALGAQVLVVYARLVTGLLIVGLVSYALRDPGDFGRCVKAYVVAQAVFVLLAMSDFYLGTGLMPNIDPEATGEIIGEQFETHRTSEFRLSGGGLPVNRFANSLILPAILALGWAQHGSRRVTNRGIGLASFAIMAAGVLATISRGAIVGLAVAGVLVLLRSFRVKATTVIMLVLFGGLAFTSGSLLARRFGVDQALAGRFERDSITGSTAGRFTLWGEAIGLFARSPVVGVGPGNVAGYTAKHRTGGSGKNPHNVYLLVLAQYGLAGFLPFMVMVILVFLRVLRPRSGIPQEIERWRPFVFGAVCGLLVANLFNDYHNERVFWLMIAFAAGFERYDLAVRRARIRDQRESRIGLSDGASSPRALGSA